jgi:hypothetical protein
MNILTHINNLIQISEGSAIGDVAKHLGVGTAVAGIGAGIGTSISNLATRFNMEKISRDQAFQNYSSNIESAIQGGTAAGAVTLGAIALAKSRTKNNNIKQVNENLASILGHAALGTGAAVGSYNLADTLNQNNITKDALDFKLSKYQNNINSAITGAQIGGLTGLGLGVMHKVASHMSPSNLRAKEARETPKVFD